MTVERIDLRTTGGERIKNSQDTIFLPPIYKKALAGKETLHLQDFTFIDGLLRHYQIIGNTSRHFGREKFFHAVSDIKDYAITLRLQDQPVEHSGIDNLDIYKERELARPSSGRIADLAYLFLHVPRVKKVYDAIHIEKMEQALPSFSKQLQAAYIQESQTLPDYFGHVTTTMEDSMIAAVEIFPSVEIEKLGFITNYSGLGYIRPQEYHKLDIGRTGIGSFTALLEEVVNHAIDKERNVTKEVITEFSKNDGLAQRLMTISLRDFNRLQDEENLFFDEIEDIPEILDTRSFYRGACPALGKIDIFERGQVIKRKVVDAYARRIMEAIPIHLVKN